MIHHPSDQTAKSLRRRRAAVHPPLPLWGFAYTLKLLVNGCQRLENACFSSPKAVKYEIAAKLIYDILLKMSTCLRVEFKGLYKENSETERFLGAYVGILESD